MQATVAFAILLVTLFFVAYATKRRFGALGLALCAGALVSNSWTSTLTPLLEQQGIVLVSPPLSVVVSVVLTILPASLLLFGGPSYNKMLGRVGGALAFALFGFVLVMDSLGTSVVFDDISLTIYRTLTNFSTIIIAVGIGLAVADILLTRMPKHRRSKSDH
jgi:hypothetical protein